MDKGRKESFNFRELTGGLVFIVNDQKMDMLRAVFENEPEDNAILACGYIDHTAGISFEVLCLGEYGPNGEITLRRGEPSVSIKLRYDGVTGIIVLLEDEIMPALQDKIDMVRENYAANDAVMKTRDIRELDEFRHPQFPDDVLLVLIRKGLSPEGIWCRIESEIGGKPAAVMLNEPNADYGVHRGDMVPFWWDEIFGQMMGIIKLAPVERWESDF